MKKTTAFLLTFAILLVVCFAGVTSIQAASPQSRNMLADWDTPDRSPAPPDGARVGIPYEGYKFGNSLLTGMKTLALTPNAEATGDKMLAMYIKDSEPVTPSMAHWTSFLFYSSDYNRPQGLQPGMPIYYIPSSNNGTDMSIYTHVSDGLYSKNTENNDVRIDYGYEGWIIIELSRVTVDWWNDKTEMEAIAADKITVMDIVAGLSNDTAIDEIQTFNGTPEEFKEICGTKPHEAMLERTAIADWDYAGVTPAAPDGSSIGIPFDGYKFGNAWITGNKAIGLTPNPAAEGDNMFAMYVKDSEAAVSGVAHWVKFLLHTSTYGVPQALQPGTPVYYIPTDGNQADLSIYKSEGNGIYSKNTENNDTRIDYGYEGWIILDLKNMTVDWWNQIEQDPAPPVSADSITVLEIAAGLSDDTVIDEIQTFNGSVSKFAKVCDTKLNIVENRADRIGEDEIGDFNGDSTVDIKDLINLKKRIANGGVWDFAIDIYADGAFNAVDMSALRHYLLTH